MTELVTGIDIVRTNRDCRRPVALHPPGRQCATEGLNIEVSNGRGPVPDDLPAVARGSRPGQCGVEAASRARVYCDGQACHGIVLAKIGRGRSAHAPLALNRYRICCRHSDLVTPRRSWTAPEFIWAQPTRIPQPPAHRVPGAAIHRARTTGGRGGGDAGRRTPEAVYLSDVVERGILRVMAGSYRDACAPGELVKYFARIGSRYEVGSPIRRSPPTANR